MEGSRPSLGPDWVGARVAAGVAIVVGLLALVGLAWWLRGLAEATALFQLLQGVLLGTLGWLYGSQGVERAQQVAAQENAARQEVERSGESLDARTQRLERRLRDLAEEIAAARSYHDHHDGPKPDGPQDGMRREAP